MRLGRHEVYGQLPCGSCERKVRDRFRCSLPGETYEDAPEMVPYGLLHTSRSKPERFRRCPWGIVRTADHGAVDGWLQAYWITKDVPALLPEASKRDPQLLEACAVIASEHAAIDREERKERERDARH